MFKLNVLRKLSCSFEDFGSDVVNPTVCVLQDKELRQSRYEAYNEADGSGKGIRIRKEEGFCNTIGS